MGVQLQASRALDSPAAAPNSTFVVLGLTEGLPGPAIVEALVESMETAARVLRIDGPSCSDPAAEADRLERCGSVTTTT